MSINKVLKQVLVCFPSRDIPPLSCPWCEIKMGYWDLEEGKDCVQKTWITTKLATALGLVGSAYHIVAFQPDTAIEAVQRATNATVTMAAMGAIFGMTTCLVAQARDAPDDPLNYFLGGCASGVFLGARTHSAMTGTSACLGLGTLAMFSKIGKMEGWRLSGEPKL
ncbi:hypothetical protein UPYG_G00036180 [Umbra pygmaea]|uniref:NADH dehydrogenase [ubiquinone] 1 alpha subcomplex subunit 11 n=1 Tax=Umbra pygmaea TaxID=75934 RepID=A0ABD0XP02_UMBPY